VQSDAKQDSGDGGRSNRLVDPCLRTCSWLEHQVRGDQDTREHQGTNGGVLTDDSARKGHRAT
jgi:hypothetical protein